MPGSWGIPFFGSTRRDRMVAEIRKRQEEAARKAAETKAHAAAARAAGSRGRPAEPRPHPSDPDPRPARSASRPRGDSPPPPSFTESRPDSPVDGFHSLGIFPIEDLLPLHRLFGSRSPEPPAEKSAERRASVVRFEEPARIPSPEPFPGFLPGPDPGGEAHPRRRSDPVEAPKAKRWRSRSSSEASEPATREKGRPGRTLSTPVPAGGWTLDPAPPRAVRELPPAAQARYEAFRDLLAQGHHPKRAAEMLGDTKYTQVRGAAAGDRFEIRLSGGHRVFFEVDKQGKSVRILEVGGHL